jgi:hypothetical protein
MIPEEIMIVKFYFDPKEFSHFDYDKLMHGYLKNSEVDFWMGNKSKVKWQKHINEERIAYTDFGDQIKYNNQNEIEWVFSPRYCWFELPEEARKEITANDLSWDFYGICYSDSYPKYEMNEGYRNNFFEFDVFKGEISWRFKKDDNFSGSTTPFKVPDGPIRRRNYEVFQGMKLFTNVKTLWVSEAEFFKRYNTRVSEMNVTIYDRYKEKYKTIFNWLCVAYNGKEKFWEILKRVYENGKLGCYEVRLEEIINTCTSNDRKYWKIQCTIASRRRRTQ